MIQIQSAIAAAVQTCIRELKQSTKLVEWNTDLSVENCVTSRFDLTISRKLEGDWHRLKPHTKQLVHDLRTLRTLFEFLVQYDAVSFWKLINSIKTISSASRHPSLWLLTPAAEMVFRLSKERLYEIRTPKPSSRTPNPVARLKPVLEANPKWSLLSTVLLEIERATNESSHSHTVLIVVKDRKTLEAIGSYLRTGRETTMARQWLRFLEAQNEKLRGSTMANRSVAGGAHYDETRLLLEEETRVRNLLYGEASRSHRLRASTSMTNSPSKKHPSALNALSSQKRKRRKIATERARGSKTHDMEDLERSGILDDAMEETEVTLMDGKPSGQTLQAAGRRHNRTESTADSTSDSRTNPNSTADKVGDHDQQTSFFCVHEPEQPRIVIRSSHEMDGDRAMLVVRDLKPSHVILYDADLSFIRAVEVYSALRDGTDAPQPKVYLLVYKASAEEKVFLKGLEREKEAFEKLIHLKKTMPALLTTISTSTQEVQQARSHLMYAQGTLPLAYDSRKGVGKAGKSDSPKDIVVDVREFRSALPSALHLNGMRLAPVTLTVGDFVLSNVHCVERKSISDLYGSFASGRLFQQAQAMVKAYKCPCLLIEFDPTKSFLLQNIADLGVEIRSDSIVSKMVILSMHFPALRMLWSRSPGETVHIFKLLKKKHSEPDVDKAMEVGRAESEEAFIEESSTLHIPDNSRNNNIDVGGGDRQGDESNESNDAARRMLLGLPGMTIQGARRVMDKCTSIAELGDMSRQELKDLIGPVAGQKVFTFFHQRIGAL